MNNEWAEVPVLFRFNGVPVKIKPLFWPMWLGSLPFFIWLAKRRQPERSWNQCVLIGLASMPWTVIADVGHAMAHTVSAKAAGAPMDEIRLASDMPRTIYFDNSVTPQQHMIRAIGGPIFSAIGLGRSLLWRRLTKPGTVGRELADISTASHGMIFVGSLMPVSVVDGGTLLKWTLIKNGSSAEEADETVKRTTIGAAMGMLVSAVVGATIFLLKRTNRT